MADKNQREESNKERRPYTYTFEDKKENVERLLKLKGINRTFKEELIVECLSIFQGFFA